MTREEFTDLLNREEYAYHTAGDCVVVTHSGHVYLARLTSLPEGVTFKNGGGVDLARLTSLPEGVTFENGGGVYLNSLTSLPEGVTFKNGGGVDLDSLTSLPKGVTFKNGGDVYLHSLSGRYAYQGKTRQFRHIDGYTMLMDKSRSQGDVTVWTARYLRGGPVADLPKCYVAERDGVFAHGKTVREAIEDVEYKLAGRADRAKVASQVRDSGRVTLPQFRAITGACREGIRAHLRGHGVDLDKTDFLPLPEALSIMAGTAYGDTFRKAMEDET